MTGNANSGRRAAPPVDLTTLKLLTVPQAMALLRLLGRPVGRAKLLDQIASGRLRVQVDYLRQYRGNPTYKIERTALDAWIKGSLVPLRVASLAS